MSNLYYFGARYYAQGIPKGRSRAGKVDTGGPADKRVPERENNPPFPAGAGFSPF
ncbi:MAG: hypothetical protein ACETWG_12230 [Candidatus Neomarinimicrobiota bacterium]